MMPKPLTDRRLLEINLLDICQQAARRVTGAGYAQHGEDAAGEAMLSVLKAVQAGASLATIRWAARNGAVDYLRRMGGRSAGGKQGYKLAVALPVSYFVAGPDGQEQERPGLEAAKARYTAIENADWIDAALRLLTPREAAALRCDLAQMTPGEAAAQMGITIRRMHQLRARGLAKLRQAVEQGKL